MNKTPGNLVYAVLIRRINRFVAEVKINGKNESVYVPNTGRLSELALPGAEVLLSPINGKYSFKILYIISSGYPVMIDSTYSNRLFHDLFMDKKIPGFERSRLIRREPVYGNHRFDFLVKHGDEERFIELKSCTLFHETTASFPDAVSTRASEHIRLLGETGKGDIVFFILKEGIKQFVPNYHTDFAFYKTLKDNTGKINIRALSVKYNSNLEITSLENVPVIIPEVEPGGLFILLFRNTKVEADPATINLNYILLCGIDTENVFTRIEKLKRRSKLFPELTGIDFDNMKIITDLPVISCNMHLSDLDSCFPANTGRCEMIFSSEEWRVYGCTENPAEKEWFWNEILTLRFGDFH